MDNIVFTNELDLKQSEFFKKSLISSFTDEKTWRNKLIWCNFREIVSVLTVDEVKKLIIPNKNKLYFYLERKDVIYKTTLNDIYNFIDNLEPWIDIDAYIFDDSLNWTVAITHDDNWLTIGLDVSLVNGK